MNSEKRRNIWLDLFKIFLAFMVVCIHFAGEAYWHFPLYRLSVPMFFMISGYFVYHADREKQMKKAKGFIFRCFKYMVFGFGIYIVYDFIACYFNGNGVGYYFTTLFYEDPIHKFFFLNQPITYSGYQLWFLIALFVVSLINYFIHKYEKEKWYYVIVPFCIAVYLFFSGYMKLLQDTDMPIRYTRNAWFFGLPNFAIGYLSAKHNVCRRINKWLLLAAGVAFFFLQIPESKIIVMEMYLSTVPAGFCLLNFFVGLRGVKCDWYYKWVGKNTSFGVYILHVGVGITQGELISIAPPMTRCVVVFLISVAIYEAYFLIAKAAKALKNKSNK